MKMRVLLLLASVAATCVAVPADAAAYLPVSDGSIYCDGCDPSDGAYVLASGDIHGVVKFANVPGLQSANAIQFTLNPYGLPLWGPNINLYGFTSSIAALDASDNSGLTFIGSYVLPDLGYGEDASFDVTGFVKGAVGRYVGFNIQSDGTDVFSSIEYNYGNPSRLITDTAAAVPEPASWAMLLLGFAAVGGALRTRRRPLHAIA